MRKIALVNQKGGVGKTTTAVNLSAALARVGQKVLLVDFDPQANATLSFGFDVNDPDRRTVRDVLYGDAAPGETVVAVGENLDLLPSSIYLAGAEVDLCGEANGRQALQRALAPIDGYDFVFVDCPPSLGVLSVNALSYVTEVFIPVQCEFFALHGMSLLLRTIHGQQRHNPRLRITGVIACMYDARTGLAKEVVADLARHFPDKVFRALIRNNVRLAEAPSRGKNIFDHAPDSAGAEDYLALAREVQAMGGRPAEPAPAAECREPAPAPAAEQAGATPEAAG